MVYRVYQVGTASKATLRFKAADEPFRPAVPSRAELRQWLDRWREGQLQQTTEAESKLVPNQPSEAEDGLMQRLQKQQRAMSAQLQQWHEKSNSKNGDQLRQRDLGGVEPGDSSDNEPEGTSDTENEAPSPSAAWNHPQAAKGYQTPLLVPKSTEYPTGHVVQAVFPHQKPSEQQVAPGPSALEQPHENIESGPAVPVVVIREHLPPKMPHPPSIRPPFAKPE